MAYSRRRTSRRTRKSVPWAGWGKESPKGRQRTRMLRDCGRKCFLGPKKSFPICRKNTCRVSSKGLWAAYIRAREWGNKPSSYKGKARPTMEQWRYQKIAKTAKRMLKNRGFKVGDSSRKSRRSMRGGYTNATNDPEGGW